MRRQSDTSLPRKQVPVCTPKFNLHKTKKPHNMTSTLAPPRTYFRINTSANAIQVEAVNQAITGTYLALQVAGKPLAPYVPPARCVDQHLKAMIRRRVDLNALILDAWPDPLPHRSIEVSHIQRASMIYIQVRDAHKIGDN